NSETFEQPEGINSKAIVTALFKAHDGALWVGTADGIGRYQDGHFNWYTNQDGVVVRQVRTIAENPPGTIWFGMLDDGLGRLQNGTLAQFRKEDGLPRDAVWTLLPDEEGALWICTDGGGLCRLKKGRVTTLSTREG